MLRRAVSEDKIKSNPIGRFELLEDYHTKEGRALADWEVRALLDTAPLPWRDFYFALLVTGMRCGEMAALRFDDIDWVAKELVVRSRTAKNNTERRIPIDPGLLTILERRRDARKDRKPGKAQSPILTERVIAKFTSAIARRPGPSQKQRTRPGRSWSTSTFIASGGRLRQTWWQAERIQTPSASCSATSRLR